MRSTTIRDLLAAQPVLAGLEEGDLDLMAGCGRNRVVEVGSLPGGRGRAGRPVLRAAVRPGRAGDRLADRAPGHRDDRARRARRLVVDLPAASLGVRRRGARRGARDRHRCQPACARSATPTRRSAIGSCSGSRRSSPSGWRPPGSGSSTSTGAAMPADVRVAAVDASSACTDWTDGAVAASDHQPGRGDRRHGHPRAGGGGRADPGPPARPVLDALRVRCRRGPDLGERVPGPGPGGACTPSAPSAPRPVRSAASAPARWSGSEGPFGVGWPVAAAEGSDTLVVGGGIGFAPLRPVVHQVLAERERFGRVAVLVGARTPADVLYQEELAEWRDRAGLQVDVTVDVAPRGWPGHVGLVTSLARVLPSRLRGSDGVPVRTRDHDAGRGPRPDRSWR